VVGLIMRCKCALFVPALVRASAQIRIQALQQLLKTIEN